jgi:hypothetical protein
MIEKQKTMQRTKINEPIRVLVDFSSSTVKVRPLPVIPRAFLWKNRRYLVRSLNLIHHEKQGDATVYYFSISTDTNTYKLVFNNLTLEWRLVEIWHE